MSNRQGGGGVSYGGDLINRFGPGVGYLNYLAVLGGKDIWIFVSARDHKSWIMYIFGYLDQYIIDCYSIDPQPTCRSTVDWESTDVLVELPLMSAKVLAVTISGAYQLTTGGISDNYRWNASHVSFDSRAWVYRYCLPIYRMILSTSISTYTRYYLLIYRLIYWLILDTIHRCIDRYQILLTHILTDTR